MVDDSQIPQIPSATATSQFVLPELRNTKRSLIEHDSQMMPLLGIWLVNLFLTLVTLGIYRFWAKTRVRRFIWGHTRFLGDRLEYTGTAMELLIGFISFIVIFIVPLTAINLLIFRQPDIGFWEQMGAAVYGALLFFVYIFYNFAAYRARRYQLTRTLWRGLRGAQTGSAMAYNFNALGYGMLTMMTFGFYYPWAIVRLAEFRLNNTWIGGQKLSFKGNGRDLFPAYCAYFFGLIGIIFLWMIVFAFGMAANGQKFGPDMAGKSGAYFGAIFVGFMILYVMVFFWYLRFNAVVGRYLAAHTTWGPVTFQYDLTAGRLLRFWMGNLGILVLTFGTGWALIFRRQVMLWSERMSMQGVVDDASLIQSADQGPKTAEGLLDFFGDMELGL